MVLKLINLYLEVPIYYIIAFIGCLFTYIIFSNDKKIDFLLIFKQAIVICGIITGMLAIPLFPFIGLQCLLHSSLGFIIGMIGLYFLRKEHYHL